MSALEALIGDLEGAMAGASPAHRDRTIARLTDLFVDQSPRLAEQHVELFDGVFGSMTLTVTRTARAHLAERLADIRNAPPGTVRLLARDEDIVVARPVLSRSWVLEDGDLVEVALRRGTDHRVAISSRPRLSETVTDVLMVSGDKTVRRAVAGNQGARLSPAARSVMVEGCRDDDSLGELLGSRHDLEPREAERVLDLLRASARARVLAALPPEDIQVTAEDELAARYSETLTTITTALGDRPIREADLAGYAAAQLRPETVCALALLSGLNVATIHRIFEQPSNDLLLVLAKAHDWSWRSVRLLLRVRDPALAERHHFRHAEQTFDGIAAATAQRVMQVLATRESSAGRQSAPRSLKRA